MHEDAMELHHGALPLLLRSMHKTLQMESQEEKRLFIEQMGVHGGLVESIF